MRSPLHLQGWAGARAGFSQHVGACVRWCRRRGSFPHPWGIPRRDLLAAAARGSGRQDRAPLVWSNVCCSSWERSPAEPLGFSPLKGGFSQVLEFILFTVFLTHIAPPRGAWSRSVRCRKERLCFNSRQQNVHTVCEAFEDPFEMNYDIWIFKIV